MEKDDKNGEILGTEHSRPVPHFGILALVGAPVTL